MVPMTVGEIASAVGGTVLCGVDVVVRKPVVIDSREVVAGSAFAAFVGDQADGHDFVRAAFDRGASLALVSRPVEVDDGAVVLVKDVQMALGSLAREVAGRLGAKVVGITGSSGKTSTKDLLFQLLEPAGPVVATARSFNNEIGFPLTVLRADTDTQHLVLEMGARGIGHLEYLCGIARPHVGAVINVGTAHAGEYPDGQRQIAQAKGELVESLSRDGVAVLNADDPHVAPMAHRTDADILWWSTNSTDAQARAFDIQLDREGRPSFVLAIDGQEERLRLRLHGAHSAANAAAAAAVAHSLGIGLTDIAERLQAAERLSAGRMQTTTRPDGVTIINDAFNANTDSMHAALTTLAAMTARRHIAVLGEMAELGDLAEEEHRQVGKIAANTGLDHLIVVGGHMAAALAHKAKGHTRVDHAPTPQDAATLLTKANLSKGDVVLFKASHTAHLDKLADRTAAALQAERHGAAGRACHQR
ncbi:UDP-N-acetylmuramoyl-tripeptide--D-alanyl-D-alanine ligase [Actinocorallia sp. API 0066]|uniref:UDP-N-acetylmuramoyl-tripeptide--D-alanyl-D- alanine ligase n=1 Tax=Actinocorallia sp. API 0066 TaxID=2896846 RepID=UPI001E46573C|nr:UDP-N-acetylmuramoyl-tripeptide--D-alanyl-D-alanine ligase [Actinocorallia sp. API 0066]MCD0448852.1 UDP-N-acetylmuramoyl-tripeptide--D-alanyl-D-alanine ligase [Actinocorallia sp. API 0066]